LIKSELVIRSKDEKFYILIVDSKLLNFNDKSMIDFPLKLPMLVKPKEYSKTKVGGYLLNDVNYHEELIINKSIIKYKTSVEEDNSVYDFVNRITATPFKINVELLEYIILNKHNLLLDPRKPHKFEDLDKRTKYQQTLYSSYKSKVNLQETILGLAEFYGKFSSIYFPVRMDQRGRIYCTSTYLNYQSTELAKSLLLFVKPGIIHKKDLSKVKYLEFYGVNCFGKDKISDKAKLN
jgi:DNA-directed RNA polymerase